MRLWRYALGLMLAMRPLAAVAPGEAVSVRARVVTVDGAAYRYQVYVPPGWSQAGKWPVILALHGGGGYGSDGASQTAEGLAPVVRRHPERFPALVVFPQSPANGTPGWQAIGGKIALAALQDTLDEFSGDPSRVTLTGLSIGGNGAWYLAYHHPERFAALLVVCGFVAERRGVMQPILYPSLIAGVADPSAGVAQRIARIPTWIFHGDADPSVPVEHSRKMAAALRAEGAPVEYTELAGVDHNAWDIAYNRPDVALWMLRHRRGSESQ
jgi:predicted peptidase